ncbi:MAG: hypothetical protein KKH17_06395 [Proteobacteria bacterium]|nr:hypothetical protein [Desulfobacteraceae bacterium]MBU4067904.1 hypothetical protein [Pseudomonadota bacterium]
MIAVIMPEFGINIFLLPLTVAIIFFLTQDFIRRYFFVNERLLDVLINDFIRYGLQLFLIFFFGLRCQLDIQLTLWIIASTALCATVFAGLQLLKTRVFIFPSFQDILEIGRYHWDFGKWLLSQNMAYWMGTQLIIYMTGAILSVTAVGAMGAMRNLVGLTNIFFLSLQNIVPSRASLVFSNKGINALNKYLQKISIIGGSLTFLIIVVPLINSEFWVRLVYGTQYQGYGWIVKWWGVYFLIGFFHRPFSFGLQVLSNTRAIFFAFLAGSIVSITMTYPLLHWAGLTGGMLAACLVQIAILAVLTKSYFKVSSD